VLGHTRGRVGCWKAYASKGVWFALRETKVLVQVLHGWYTVLSTSICALFEAQCTGWKVQH
jgi:hypothetical protein